MGVDNSVTCAGGRGHRAHCSRARTCLDVVSSLRCRVVYLRVGDGHLGGPKPLPPQPLEPCPRVPQPPAHLSAFRSPSVLVEGCSFRTLMHPFIWHGARGAVRGGAPGPPRGDKFPSSSPGMSLGGLHQEGPRRHHGCAGRSGVAAAPPGLPTATHVNFGGLGEGPHGVDVVVEDDDADHHPHAEEEGLGVGEAAAVLPAPREGLGEPGGGGTWGPQHQNQNAPGVLTGSPASPCRRRPWCSGSRSCPRSGGSCSESGQDPGAVTLTAPRGGTARPPSPAWSPHGAGAGEEGSAPLL